MSTCQRKGCNNKIWSHGFCRRDQWCRTDEKYKKAKEYAKENRKAKKQILSESRKRKSEHPKYLQRVVEHRFKCKEEGTYFCFFCLGKEDLTTIDKWLCNHHWEERGANYLNVETWSWAHNLCHNLWHFATMEELKEQEWYNNDFMNRLKVKSIVAYSKQRRKEEKNIELNLDN